MKNHKSLILGQKYIQLNSIESQLYRSLESSHSILLMFFGNASMTQNIRFLYLTEKLFFSHG